MDMDGIEGRKTVWRLGASEADNVGRQSLTVEYILVFLRIDAHMRREDCQRINVSQPAFQFKMSDRHQTLQKAKEYMRCREHFVDLSDAHLPILD